jgi:hypothetical protein
MNTYTKWITLALAFLLSQAGFAQTSAMPRDTISYKSTDTFELMIVVDDYHLLKNVNDLPEIFEGFQKRLTEIQPYLTDEHLIEYYYPNKIDLVKESYTRSFESGADGKLAEKYRHEARIFDPLGKYHVLLKFNDVSEISQVNFSSLMKELVAGLPEKQRFLRYLEYGTDQGTGKLKLQDNRPSGVIDMLSLQAGVGANVYRNKFLTDISGEISLQLSQKGILRNQFYVSNNLMFAFNAENTSIINNFTNIGYRRNLSNNVNSPNWLGVELGTLTKRNGDIFQPNTMRLGVNWQAGKHISIAPQLYFNGFFQQVSPGIRVGIGF